MNNLESAVAKLLDSVKFKYIRIENYRCFKCGQVQNSKAKGFPDFFVYYPFSMAIECKMGKSQLSNKQKEIQSLMIKAGIPYLVIRDTVDILIQLCKNRGIIV